MSKSFVTPLGIGKYLHLLKPDTQGKFPTGKYSAKLILTPEAAKPLIAAIALEAKAHKNPTKLGYKNEMIKSGDTKKETGNIQFNFSSKFPPVIIDAKGQAIDLELVDKNFSIGSGSTIRVGCEFFSYDTGISLQMKQVQVIKLVSERESMFDAVEDGTFDGSEYEDDDNQVVASSAVTDANVAALGI